MFVRTKVVEPHDAEQRRRVLDTALLCVCVCVSKEIIIYKHVSFKPLSKRRNVKGFKSFGREINNNKIIMCSFARKKI